MDFHITEEKWQVILKELKEEEGIHKSNEYALRIFIEGIYYIMKSGSQWRLSPKCYGNWRAVYMRFIEWSKKGIWDRLHLSQLHLSQLYKSDTKIVMMDSTIARAHACSAGYEKDGNEKHALREKAEEEK